MTCNFHQITRIKTKIFSEISEILAPLDFIRLFFVIQLQSLNKNQIFWLLKNLFVVIKPRNMKIFVTKFHKLATIVSIINLKILEYQNSGMSKFKSFKDRIFLDGNFEMLKIRISTLEY